jgi:hypothetical protein
MRASDRPVAFVGNDRRPGLSPAMGIQPAARGQTVWSAGPAGTIADLGVIVEDDRAAVGRRLHGCRAKVDRSGPGGFGDSRTGVLSLAPPDAGRAAALRKEATTRPVIRHRNAIRSAARRSTAVYGWPRGSGGMRHPLAKTGLAAPMRTIG